MNKLNVILVTALVFAGGAGLILFSGKDVQAQDAVSKEQGIYYEQMEDMMDNKVMGKGKMNSDEMHKVMGKGKMNSDEMHKFMEEGDVNFGQMKEYMTEMHPDLDNQQLEEMHKGMHGTDGSNQSSNFRGMGSMHK